MLTSADKHIKCRRALLVQQELSYDATRIKEVVYFYRAMIDFRQTWSNLAVDAATATAYVTRHSPLRDRIDLRNIGAMTDRKTAHISCREEKIYPQTAQQLHVWFRHHETSSGVNMDSLQTLHSE